MLKETKSQFVDFFLDHPPTLSVDQLASQVHETNRFPDPYIFILKNGKLAHPQGINVEDQIIKNGYPEAAEYTAFTKIQDWVKTENEGVCFWFSPPYPGKYPVSKVIISELSTTRDQKTKVLFNRALVLDVDEESLFALARPLTSRPVLTSKELRSTPLFPSAEKVIAWIDTLTPITNQAEMVQNDVDLELKKNTYHKLTDLEKSIPVTGPNTYFAHQTAARQRGMFGSMPESCPTIGSSGQGVFETFLGHALFAGAVRELRCTCPSCHTKVNAKIENGTIHCPACGKSAPYAC